MPYIDQPARQALAERDPDNAGELNFEITNLVLSYLQRKPGGPRYQDFNDAIGVLECAKLELYRRMVAPYEDLKIEQNGDVYPPA